MARKDAQHAAGTIDGHELPYWLERIYNPDRAIAEQARSALGSVGRLPAAEKQAFAPAVPALLDALSGQAFTGDVEVEVVAVVRRHVDSASYGLGCLLGLGDVVLPAVRPYLDTVKVPRFSRPLAECLIDLADEDPGRVLPILLHYLYGVHHRPTPVRTVAETAAGLGKAGARLAPFLIEAYGTVHESERRAIVRALGCFGTGVPTLLKALENRDASTRQQAVAALAKIKDASTVPHLARMLKDEAYPVAAEAAGALATVGAAARPSVPALQQALASRSKVVRAAAQAALAAIDAEDAAKAKPKVKVAPRIAKLDTIAASLFQSVLDNPEDDAPRLVYADWLEEHGDVARADFIRVQCALAQLPENDPGEPELKKREKQLFADHQKEWRKGIPVWAARTIRFERGFPALLSCTTREFLKSAAGVFTRAPIQTVKLRNCLGHGKALSASPFLARLTRLEADLVDDDLEPLAASDAFANLRALKISLGRLGDRGARALAACRHLTRLTTLDLVANALGPSGVASLAGSPSLAGVTQLLLGGNDIGDGGVRGLVRSPHLRRLEVLGLWTCRLTPAGIQALAGSEGLAHVHTLRLTHNDVGDLGAEALARSPYVTRLRSLEMGHCQIGSVGALALAASPHLGQLENLELFTNRVTREAAAALATSTNLASLRTLDLRNNDVGDKKTLADSRPPSLPPLEIQ